MFKPTLLAALAALAIGCGGANKGGDTTTTTGGDTTETPANEDGNTTASDPVAARGTEVYASYCASCHGDDGAGGGGTPGVFGAEMLKRYDSEASLLDYLKAEMPQDAPGSLEEEDYQAVTTYLWSTR